MWFTITNIKFEMVRRKNEVIKKKTNAKRQANDIQMTNVFHTWKWIIFGLRIMIIYIVLFCKRTRHVHDSYFTSTFRCWTRQIYIERALERRLRPLSHVSKHFFADSSMHAHVDILNVFCVGETKSATRRNIFHLKTTYSERHSSCVKWSEWKIEEKKFRTRKQNFFTRRQQQKP